MLSALSRLLPASSASAPVPPSATHLQTSAAGSRSRLPAEHPVPAQLRAGTKPNSRPQPAGDLRLAARNVWHRPGTDARHPDTNPGVTCENVGGRYWDRTSDLFGVNSRNHPAHRP
jgi:hypothetical protein